MQKSLNFHKTIYVITSVFSLYIFVLYAADILNPFTWDLNVQNVRLWQELQLGILIATVLYLSFIVKTKYSSKTEVVCFFISMVLVSRGHQRISSALMVILLFFLLLYDVIKEKALKYFIKNGANIYLANVLSIVAFRSIRLYYFNAVLNNARINNIDYRMFNLVYFLLFVVLGFITYFVLRNLNKSLLSYIEILATGILFKYFMYDMYIENTFNILFYCLFVFGVIICMVNEQIDKFKIKQEASFSQMSNEELLELFGTRKTKDK